MLPPDASGQPRYRHLHAFEVALLNCIPIDLMWSTHQRLNLCAIGQMAAPLQSLWVGSIVLQQMGVALGLSQPANPIELMMNFKAIVWKQAKNMYLTIPVDVAPARSQERTQIQVQVDGSSPFVVSVPIQSTVKELLEAQEQLFKQAIAFWVSNVQSGMRLSPNALLKDNRSLKLECGPQNNEVDVAVLPDLFEDFPMEEADQPEITGPVASAFSAPALAPPAPVQPICYVVATARDAPHHAPAVCCE